MKILLTGAAGQLGNELYPLLSRCGRAVAADVNPAQSNAPDCIRVDLGNEEALSRLLEDVRPDLIVNAAAYTAVDRAESDAELAAVVNEALPRRLADWAARHSCALMHYSTDYVFDGCGDRPYRENDPTRPLSVYGATKLAGEQAVRDSGCTAVILRTAWVYSSHGHNFVLSMLRLGRDRPRLSIVDDQVGCPTWAANLAGVTLACLESGLLGQGGGCRLYHYSDADVVSWFGFAALIFELGVELGLLEAAPELEAIDSAGYPQAATRPHYSVLDTRAVQAATGFQPPALRDSLRACLKELRAHG